MPVMKTVWVTCGQPQLVEGLCPECSSPGLVRFKFAMLDGSGAGSKEVTACRVCFERSGHG